MKILFLASSFEDPARSKTINHNSHYPLGMGYLHAYLEKCGHNVRTLFLNDYPYDACKRIFLHDVKSMNPDIVGFNILTQNRASTFKLIKIIHSKYPRIQILIGGIHTTIMYHQIVKQFSYVIAVLGEGELTTEELLQKIQTKKSLRTVAGIAYVYKNKVIKTKDRELIKDLDILPYPKHDIFFTPERTIACMITSRGCPFHCSFCVLYKITRSYPRKRSVVNVMNEIEYLVSKYPQLETVWLHDDQFFLDNDRVIAICKEIIKKKIKLRFICSGRFKPISKKMVTMLQRAGFIQVLLGLESGSNRILKLCHKYITQDDVIKTMTLFKNTKIQVTTFLIVGLYGETDETIDEAIHFIQKIQKIKYVFFGDINIPILYPGTELYDIAKKAKIIKDSFWLTDRPTPFFTAEYSVKNLLKFKERTLESIGLLKIFTPRGFIHQYHMIPTIIMFIWKNIPMFPVYAKHVIQRFYPNIYFRIRRIFFPKVAIS